MSVHSCGELCHLDSRFHDIIKNDGPHDAWYPGEDEMREHLQGKINELYELLIKLELNHSAVKKFT